MKCPGPSWRCNIFPMRFQSRVCFADVNDVKFWILLFYCSYVSLVLQMRKCGVDIIIIFASQNFSQFFTMIRGGGIETIVTIENIEDLYFHVGQITWHDQYYESATYKGDIL